MKSYKLFYSNFVCLLKVKMLIYFLAISMLLLIFVGTFMTVYFYLEYKKEQSKNNNLLNEQDSRNKALIRQNAEYINIIQNKLQKESCSKDRDRTNCFTITRKSGTNEVNTKYIQIEVKPLYREMNAKQQYKVTYQCRFVPSELTERDIILFDGAMARPEKMVLNRTKGTLDVIFHIPLNTLKFKMYPYINSLSIMKILVDELST